MDKTALRKGIKKKQTPAEALLTTSITQNQKDSLEELEVNDDVIQETELSESSIIIIPEEQENNLDISENRKETKSTPEIKENQTKTESVEVPAKTTASQKSENGFHFNVNIKVPVKEEICSVRKQIVIKPSVNEKVNKILKSKNMSFNFLINQFLETFVEENEIKSTKQKN